MFGTRDRLNAVSVFATIVESGNRKLSDLGARLETRLVTRSTRKLVPTDAGRDDLAACARCAYHRAGVRDPGQNRAS
jgi:hypothetical protein